MDMCGVQTTTGSPISGSPFTTFKEGSLVGLELTNLAKLAGHLFLHSTWTVVAITDSPKLMARITSFGRTQRLGPRHILFLETAGHPHLLYSSIYTDPPLHSAVITGLCVLK